MRCGLRTLLSGRAWHTLASRFDEVFLAIDLQILFKKLEINAGQTL